MKRPLARQLAILTLGIFGAFVVPANGKADLFSWGGGCCGSPYTAGYFPSYSSYYGPGDGWNLYGVGYYGGYDPLSFGANYYGSGCCGGLGSSCGSLGCGSCGTGSCGTGSCGTGSCGTGCCGAPLSYSGCCGSGPSCCGSGVACSGGCGIGPTSGPGCDGNAPAGPAPKKPQPRPEEGFVPRGSPDYDETPPRARRPKAPTPAPEPGPGVNGPPGATGTEGPANGEPAASGGYKRNQGVNQGPSAGSKAQGEDSAGFKPPATPKPPSGSPPADAQPFGANKPVTPPPQHQSGKKAPIINLPDADSADDGHNRATASNEVEQANVTSNPALHLQERSTWGRLAMHEWTIGRIASTAVPTPERIKSQMAEWVRVPIQTNFVRN